MALSRFGGAPPKAGRGFGHPARRVSCGVSCPSWRLRDTGEIRCTSQDPGVLRNVHQMRTPRETPARRNVLGLRRDFVGRRGAGKGVPPGDGQTVPRPVGPWRPHCLRQSTLICISQPRRTLALRRILTFAALRHFREHCARRVHSKTLRFCLSVALSLFFHLACARRHRCPRCDMS